MADSTQGAIGSDIVLTTDTIVRRNADNDAFEAVALNKVGSNYTPLWISGRFFNCAVNALAKGTIAGTADRIEVAPFIPPVNMTWDRVRLNVTTGVASALARVVVYDSDATDGLPGTLLDSSTDLDCSSTNSVPEDATFSYSFKAGRLYWVGVHHSSTATLRGVPVGGLLSLGTDAANGTTNYTCFRRASQTFGSGSPNPFGSGNITSAIMPEVKFRIA
jgi:hypothetical protein